MALAVFTTFEVAVAYIIFVNPEILSASEVDWNSVFVATCLDSASGTLITGLYVNHPIAVAPGMGLNVAPAEGAVVASGVYSPGS